MSSKNYEDVVHDIKNGRHPKRLEELSERTTMAMLKKYRRIQKDIIREAVNEAWISILQYIHENKVYNPEGIYKMLYVSADRKLYSMIKKEKRYCNFEEDDSYIHGAYQPNMDFKKEDVQKEILKICKKELSKRDYSILKLICDHPDISSKVITERYNMNYGACRIAKYRTLQRTQKVLSKYMSSVLRDYDITPIELN